ncbi:MAG TPA: hypothetical protein VGD17_19060 [Chitinophagaceae bacterium]
MSRQSKILLFTIIVFAIALVLIVYRYESLLKEYKTAQKPSLGTITGGLPSNKEYTASEIIHLIKSSKEYIGDSITLYDNGDMLSSNGKFQGTIAAVINSKDNMDIVYSNTKNNKLPLHYNIYVLAATYYRQQYADEFK